jgi:phosphatidate cytidylyltransferase
MRKLTVPDVPGFGRDMVLTVVFGTWAGDTMAYFTGKYFGSTPMVPTLSPKKTWEGFLGGLIGTVLLVVLIGLYTELGPTQSVILGATIGIVGPIGDLFESLVKRDVQIKDSGRGIPGHGGVLDRFDALLWTSVASYFVLTAGFGF